MKIALWTNPDSCRRYSAPDAIPAHWQLTFLPRGCAEEEALALAAQAQVLVVDPMQPVSAALIAGMKALRLIQTEGVGYHRVDLPAARAAGITVCNNAGVNAGAVAEQTVLLMLAVLRRLHEGEAAVYAGRQGEFKNRCMAEGLLPELGACTVGLLGLGAIARQTAKRLLPFGCRLCYYAPHRRAPEEERALGVEYRPFDELLETSDILSLHLPVTAQTRGIMGSAQLRRMKPGAVLINTARGELVDQRALCQALESGHLSGAGLDTLYPEPVQQDNPLLHLSATVRQRLVLSPHIGGITPQAFARSYEEIWANIRRLEAGEPLKHIIP